MIGVVTWITEANAVVFSSKAERAYISSKQLRAQSVHLGAWIQFNAELHHFDNNYCITSYHIVNDALPTRICSGQVQVVARSFIVIIVCLVLRNGAMERRRCADSGHARYDMR